MSREQAAAIDAIARWQGDPLAEPEFLLAGYAGTGKTTLLQHFVNGQGKKVLCLTPTGKAANILKKRLKEVEVSTIHRALYVPVPPSRMRLRALEIALAKDPKNEKLAVLVKREKEKLAGKDLKFSPKLDHKILPNQLVVVDEASMMTRFMRRDLLATGAKLLYVGDPEQLPPVRDSGFFQTTAPHAMLEEIQRQALDSPIVRLSMSIRSGESTGDMSEPGCRRMSKNRMDPEEWFSHDQVLTGSNDTRRKINRFFRKHAGLEDWRPRAGEKLICLKNYYDEEVCLVNGGMAVALSDFFGADELNSVWGNLKVEDETVNGANCDPHPFKAHYDDSALQELPEEGDERHRFDFGYAITVHKSQGSEWDRVILADDGMRQSDRTFRRRWLYTAVTRAKKELVWLY